jgi:hypothetical protein
MLDSFYLERALNPVTREKILRKISRLLRPHIDEFDSIAFQGFSGALIAPVVATRLKKHCLIVRKNRNSSHAISDVEGYFGNYVIIDDLWASGDTLRNIKKKIDEQCNKKWSLKNAKLQGVILYNAGEYSETKINKEFPNLKIVKAFYV